MPKIVENLQERLMLAARQKIESDGYAALTIRSVARACNVGVGTVYNYFPSKDALIASYLLSDWNECIAVINEANAHTDSAQTVLLCIFEQLTSFTRRHAAVFEDEAAAASFSASFGKYHAMLRTQLAAPIRRFFENDFAAEFAAESLLVWTMDGHSFPEIFSVLGKLL